MKLHVNKNEMEMMILALVAYSEICAGDFGMVLSIYGNTQHTFKRQNHYRLNLHLKRLQHYWRANTVWEEALLMLNTIETENETLAQGEISDILVTMSKRQRGIITWALRLYEQAAYKDPLVIFRPPFSEIYLQRPKDCADEMKIDAALEKLEHFFSCEPLLFNGAPAEEQELIKFQIQLIHGLYDKLY